VGFSAFSHPLQSVDRKAGIGYGVQRWRRVFILAAAHAHRHYQGKIDDHLDNIRFSMVDAPPVQAGSDVYRRYWEDLQKRLGDVHGKSSQPSASSTTSSHRSFPSLHQNNDICAPLHDEGLVQASIAQQKGDESMRIPLLRQSEGHEWQEELTSKQQNDLYKIVRRRWKTTDKAVLRRARHSLRMALDLETAKKILSGDEATIRTIADATFQGERARLKDIKQQQQQEQRGLYAPKVKKWPDPYLHGTKKRAVVKNLKSHWGGLKGPAVRARLIAYYEPHFAPALLDRNSADFKAVADHIHRQTVAGSKTGAKPLKVAKGAPTQARI
jgi:hypothetical protein